MTTFWSALINGAILSALLSLCVWFALRFAPRHAINAATRYAIWWMVLAVTIILPLSYVKWRNERFAPTAPAHIALPEPGLVSPVPATMVTASSAPVYGISLPVRIPAGQWLRPVTIFWICGSLVLLARVFVSYAALYRRSACATDAPPELTRRVDVWLAQSGASRRRVRLALSREIAIPNATGPLRPSILIPAMLFECMSREDLDQIGLHEATHLARGDDYVLFFQRIVEALFALHPVVRWLTRQIDLEREIACDDIVAGLTKNPRCYADCLTRTVAQCGVVRASLAAAGAADSRSHLSRRVELLVSGSRQGAARLPRTRFAAMAVALICGGGLLARTPFLLAFAVPKVAILRQATLQAVTPKPPVVQRPVLISQSKPPVREAPKEQAPPPSSAEPKPLYILGTGDAISVMVFDEKNLSNNYAIGSDGRVSMPLVGDLRAIGLTLPQLQDLIAQKLRDDAGIPEPVVKVQLLRNNSKQFLMIGGVGRPGPRPLSEGATILDALAVSGFKDFANKENIILRRGTREFHFDYRQVVQGVHMEQNITIEDGDIIIVPE